MKTKLIIYFLTMMFLFTQQGVKADELYCCGVPNWSMSCVGRVLTNAFGVNLAAKKVAKIAIKRALKHSAPGDYDVKIDSYSAKDLKQGKFKAVEIVGRNISMDGVYVSAATMKSLCEYNYVDYNKDPVIFHTDLPLAFTAEITADNLNKTFIDLGYIKKLSDLSFGNYSFFYVDDVAFKLKNNKLYLVTKMKAPLIMGEKIIKITFSGKLNVEDGKIVLENVSSENLRNVNLSGFVDMINNMNPFDIPLQVFKENHTILSIKSVRILDNKIYVDGIMVMKRSCYGQKEEKK